MKLQGIRVIDLSTFLPGPYMTMLMSDHGADVIKVEAPGDGDAGRTIGPADGPSTVFFRNVNRGKRSIIVDLKNDEGHNLLLRMVKNADVFVESFRPGVMQRLGIDYQTLSALNPRLIYCSISAFGQDGPYVNRPAHDLVIEALSGVLSITVGSDGAPTIPGIPIADIVSGLHALAGVLMALLRRTQTGTGDLIDISMQECLVSAMPNVLGPTLAEGRQPNPKQERSTGGSAFYQIYRTKDGRYVVLGAQELKFAKEVLTRLGLEHFVSLCERGPGEHQKPVIDALASAFETKTMCEWEEWFANVDAAFAPVKTLPEALMDSQLTERGFILRDHLKRRHIGNPVRFLNEPAAINLEEPMLGQHQKLLPEL